MILDFLIVGQGIAGTTLAWHLLEEGANIKIIDQAKEKTSSWAAAGLYNPVTGRKMVKTWLADQLFPYLEKFYRDIENKTGGHFLHPVPIYRPFISLEEQNDWHLKSCNNAFAPFVEKVYSQPQFPDALHDHYGGLLLKQSGYLDVSEYLQCSREYFLKKNIYSQAELDVSALKISDGNVTYQEERTRYVIFCDGPDATTNPYFQWLPFSLVKGEVLMVRPEGTHEVIYNRGIFVLPVGDICKVGSTYDHHDLTYENTENGRKYLEEKIRKLCKFRYQVIGQRAGVRPATKDRKPFVGLHPEHKPLGIFNGLGTKGVSLAPFFARQFTRHLLKAEALEEAVDIKRFYHLYNSVLT